MNFDSFLGEKRWEILQVIAEKASSPLELAELLSTTVSYISQQLKLLEAIGIIQKTKTGIAEKGKPRNLYSLSNEFAYISTLTKEVAEKKMIYLTPYHKSALMIWSLPDAGSHEAYHKFLIKLSEMEKDIEIVYLDKETSSFFIVGNASLKTKLETFVKGLDMKVRYSIIDETKVRENYIPLLKGGLNRT